ncbi:MAG: M64 family metallopeptidase [Muribaculaceae bacterium]|nr:M64 family metallopeptidase [Muribaculaceae bacterium]
MGDGFSSEAEWTTGNYGRMMREGMENIFMYEPFKSFRNRFNVYMVHVVSDGAAGTADAALQENDTKCKEYASRIPGIDLANATIINIANRAGWDPTAYTNINEGDASIIHMTNGGAAYRENNTFIHEMGHAFGKMLDEYITANETVTEDNRQDFEVWLASQHAAGIGLNLDCNNDPNKIRWAHLLSDLRYKDQLGIYKGAYRYPQDLYRSQENSMMNMDYTGSFNPVHREILYRRIMMLSEGPEWQYDFEEFATYDAINR